jgi:carbamoyl-phosphate synthase large subunit
MNRVNILFLGGAKRVSFAEHIIQSGEKRGEDVYIYSYELTKEVPIASIGEVILGERWSSESIYSDLTQVIREKEIHIVLPFVDAAIEIASVLRKNHPNVFIPCSPLETCKIMFDKKLANDWFLSHSLPIPDYYPMTNSFPLILKPRKGSASKGLIVVNNKHELNEVNHLEDYLIQEYIVEGKEYTVDCYVSQKGEIISIVPRIRIEVLGGEVINTKTLRDEEIIELSKKILLSDAFRGPVTIQFIRTKSGDRTMVMEINPRLGGGVIASMEAGADISSMILAESKNEPLRQIRDWKENTLMARYLKEVIFYANNY